MKLLSARAPTTLRASHQRCDRGGSSAGAARQPDHERQPDAFRLGLAQHGQVRTQDRQQCGQHHEVKPRPPLDRRDVEGPGDPGDAAQTDRAHHGGQIRPRPVLERAVERDALPVAFLHQRVAVEPPEPGDREHRDHRERDEHGGDQRPQGRPQILGGDQNRDGGDGDQAEPVVEEDPPAQQQTGARACEARAGASCRAPPSPGGRCPMPRHLRSSRRPTPRSRWRSAPPRRTGPPGAPSPRRTAPAPPRRWPPRRWSPPAGTSSAAHAPPPSPMRSSHTNVSRAPGG